MNNSDGITITKTKIVSFFRKHQKLDPEETISSFIDIMERLYDSINNNVNNSLVENLLANIQQINNNIQSIDSNINTIKDDTSTTFTHQMNDFKRDYMENLRLNLTSNVSDKIEPLIKEQMNIMLERTSTIFNETLPKNNKLLQESLHKTVTDVNNDINSDARKLLENTITQDSLNKFINNVDSKMTNALTSYQQVFISNLESTERRLDNRISTVKETTDSHLSSTTSLANNVTSLLQKMENSSIKGAMSENIIFNILHSLYPMAGIEHVGQQKETGDIIVTRPNKPKILVENKNWTRNVSQDEVKKFIHDIEMQKCSGIFLSQNYGIANKGNYEINIHDNNILVYVHETNNDPDKIKIAIDIIDHFKSKLDDINSDVDTDLDTIPKEKLDAINNEVLVFVNSKMAMISLTKDYSQKMLKQLDEMRIPTLEDYLSSRYATSSSKFVCEYCDFVAKNKAALAAHKRRCRHKPCNNDNLNLTQPKITSFSQNKQVIQIN